MNFVIDRFEKAAEAFPKHAAIICEDGQSISYEKLNRQADAVASTLVKFLKLKSAAGNASTNTPLIALLMERNMGIVCMMLAIHKACCAYVPIDPAFPPDRQAYILEHSRCDVLIVDEDCQEAARSMPYNPKHVFLASAQGLLLSRQENGKHAPLHAAAQHSLVRSHGGEELAYVLYTSGSTGKPKGVAVKQIGVDNIIHFFAEELGVNQHSRVMCLTTFCFDISVLETFLPLTRGAAIVLANSSTRKDPFRIIELMEEHQISVFQATPTTYEMLLATGWMGDERIQFLVGGEAFRPTILPLATKSKAVLNVYGPTETTIWSSSFRIDNGFAAYSARMGIAAVPIGQPISSTQLYLVNETMQQVPSGEEGELCIGGIGVAAGYLHAPDLTADKFIANPFGQGLIYRTGDVVRQLSDGNYIFVRRLDDQVKIDGFRIELEEIEKVYMADPAVDQAVALVRNNQLILYVKPISQMDPHMLEIIHDKAKRSLPYYMVPKHTVILAAFVMTPNGKLDKKALPDPPSLKALPLPVVEAPIENILHGNQPRPVSAIICDVIEQLRGNRPTPSSTLATFGLDSLTSVMLIRRLQLALDNQVHLKMAELFVPGTTVRSLAIKLYSKASQQTRDSLHLIEESEGDLEEGCRSELTQQQADHYGTALLANKRLFEGLRGIFTFMVLWNHWHGVHESISPAFNVDTSLFYMISGFTTASQLRAYPNIRKGEDGLLLSPKPAFALGRFWLLRAVGLYPVMWLALLLNAPVWMMQDKYDFPDHLPGMPQSAGATKCTFLYVIGMNVWSETCTRSGPDVRYASGLLIVMMIYGLYRYYWSALMNKLINQSPAAAAWCDRTNGLTNALPISDRSQSWHDYLGKMAIYLNYNAYHPEVFKVFAIFVIAVAVFMLGNIAMFHIKILSSIEFFTIAAWFLPLSEMWCGRAVANHTPDQPPLDDYVTPTDDAKRLWKWMKEQVGMGNARYQRLSTVDYECTELLEPEEVPVIKTTERTTCLGLLWRFTPDLLAISVGILLSCIGGLCTDSMHKFATFNENMLVPAIVLVFIMISVQQRGMARYNATRLFLESDAMNFLGYISYPVYLLQNVFLQYYFTFIFKAANYRYHPDDPDRRYFRAIPLGYRFIAIMMVIAIGWFVQKYVQDYMVANAFARYLQWSSK